MWQPIYTLTRLLDNCTDTLRVALLVWVIIINASSWIDNKKKKISIQKNLSLYSIHVKIIKIYPKKSAKSNIKA